MLYRAVRALVALSLFSLPSAHALAHHGGEGNPSALLAAAADHVGFDAGLALAGLGVLVLILAAALRAGRTQ